MIGTTNEVHVALMSGSLRVESVNTAALRAAQRYFERVSKPDGRSLLVTQVPIDDLPPYSGDIVEVGWPRSVQRLRRAVADADALMISTPEYNAAMPGALKNALDWLAPPYGHDHGHSQGHGVLDELRVVTLSVSHDADGAGRAQDDLRRVLKACGALLVNPHPVCFNNACDTVDAHGEIADPEMLASIRRLCAELLARTVGRSRDHPANVRRRSDA